MRVAVIGAGLAGLACARALTAAAVEVVVFDKSRGPGGRCATRQVAAGSFDHGAWQWSAGVAMAAEVQHWQAQGLLIEHAGGWIARPCMNALPQALARGLPLVTSCEIAAIEHGPGRWRLRSHGPWPASLAPDFDAVAVAVPAEQARPLLSASPALTEALRAVHSEPCWTVMAAWPGALPLKQDLGPAGHAALAWARRDDVRPGRARVPGIGSRWVLHAEPYWSAHNLDAPPEEVIRRLLAALQERTGLRLAHPAHAAAHRWRHAQVREPLAAPCGWDAAQGLGACGDAWHRDGPADGLERAWRSGQALARAIAAAG